MLHTCLEAQFQRFVRFAVCKAADLSGGDALFLRGILSEFDTPLTFTQDWHFLL